MTLRTVKARRLPLAEETLGFFRFGKIGDQHIVTNDAGEYHLLSGGDFERFVSGQVAKGDTHYEALVDKGFLRDGLNADALADKVRRKKRFVGVGPHLHIIIATLRCNQGCKYCHASRTDMDRVDTDMTIETAKKVVDHAMQSSSPYINFEFQGGEATINMPVVKFVVEYSREKNKYEKKTLAHSIVTNMTHMDEATAQWLIENDVLVCTSLDGPEVVHDFNRTWKKDSSAFQTVTNWIRYFNMKYVERGKDPRLWHVDALMTTTRKTFEHYKELVDLYVSMGMHSIHLRPLNPYGFALSTWKTVGYTPEEYLDFYAKTLDYIIELNQQGIEICEGTAATFLMKMLTPDDPNFVDIRSPCGAGTGQVAYNYDGKIFTCDEGRMVSAMGNDAFMIGDVQAQTITETIQHPTVKAMAIASLQDTLPSCESCWNKPYCGVCPMHNYMSSGDIFGQRPRSSKCKEHYTISTLLMQRMANDTDGSIAKMFRRWTLTRPREDSGSCKV